MAGRKPKNRVLMLKTFCEISLKMWMYENTLGYYIRSCLIFY